MNFRALLLLAAAALLAACSSVSVRSTAAPRPAAGSTLALDLDAARHARFALCVADGEPAIANTLSDYNAATARVAARVLADASAAAHAGIVLDSEFVLAGVRALPASALRLHGLRDRSLRAGIGVPYVLELPASASDEGDPVQVVRQRAATAILQFSGSSGRLVVRDPTRADSITLEDCGERTQPVAADFGAPYALWLARSKLGRAGERNLFAPRRRDEAARLYLLQPFDPRRRVVVLLHGLGSSPEAWTDLANDLLGDPRLQQRYQVWEVFYPTDLPIAESRRQIEHLLLDALATLDPDGSSAASHDMTLVGHSMGGVIARLLVVDAGDVLWRAFFGREVDDAQRARLALLEPYLGLRPLPAVRRAIFLAAPHRGSPVASHWIGRFGSRLVRLPLDMVQTLASVRRLLEREAPEQVEQLQQRQFDGIEALRDTGRYLQSTSALAIADGVRFHSIVARKDAAMPLSTATDGLVPYASAHLDGADSELVITSGHGVQETPEASAEVRRILFEAD